jgi:hypothetical protein
LSSRAVEARIGEITAALGLDSDQVIPFSAVTGLGRDELAAAIVSLMQPREPAEPGETNEPAQPEET